MNGKLDIDAGFERDARGFFLIRDDVMDGAEFLRAEIVGRDHAGKSPLAAQDVEHQMFVAVIGDAVDFVVARHHGGDVRFFHGGFERLEPIFADDAFGIERGADVGAAFGLAVDGEMFRGGEDVRFVERGAGARVAGALVAGDGGDSEARDEIRIFAVGFFGAAPARIAIEIENRREALLDAAGAGFGGRGGENFVEQIRIPR